MTAPPYAGIEQGGWMEAAQDRGQWKQMVTSQWDEGTGGAGGGARGIEAESGSLGEGSRVV